VLRGRLDEAGAAGAAGPGGAVFAETRQRRAPRVHGARLAWGFAGATLVAGAGLLTFAHPAWALGIGALSLLACAVTVFALTAVPDEEPQ
jgi:hypothetical protein